MCKTALITGITGQDGSYLAEFLLKRGYRVFGMTRQSAIQNLTRIEHLLSAIEIRQADLMDQLSLISLVESVQPDEIYNLAAQSFVPTSWQQPVLTAEFTALGVTRLLEAIRLVNPRIRYYQASSSEMFGKAKEIPQTEETPFRPRSPYGVAKTYGHYITVNYREGFNIFACSGILFNHESPRRGAEFLSRKVTRGASRIKLGLEDKLELGNLEAARDWGFAGDYVEAMWLMMQLEEPGDFVIGTGRSHKVRDLVEASFSRVDLDWRDFVVVDEHLFRPAEVDHLVANPAKAKSLLGWEPKTDFRSLINLMVDADLDLAKREQGL
jgi:GDPmannose 4,6-dehydratase